MGIMSRRRQDERRARLEEHSKDKAKIEAHAENQKAASSAVEQLPPYSEAAVKAGIYEKREEPTSQVIEPKEEVQAKEAKDDGSDKQRAKQNSSAPRVRR